MSLYSNLTTAHELDEASGNALDSFGSKTLTDNNSVGSTGGRIYGPNGTARDFEDANSEFFSSSDSVFQTATDTLWEVWFEPESITGLHAVFGKRASGSEEYHLYVDYDGGTPRLKFDIWSNGGVGTSLVFSSGVATQWYHLLVWRRADGYVLGRLSISGYSLDYTSGPATPATGSAEFRVGADAYTGQENYFDGRIGPLRRWNFFPDDTGTNTLLTTATWLNGVNNDGQGRTLAEIQAAVPTCAFVGEDTTTQGSWIGVYGADGYYFPGDLAAQSDPPAYADLVLFRGSAQGSGSGGFGTASQYTWSSIESPSTLKALQNPADPTGNRYSITYYSAAGVELMWDAGSTVRRISIYYLDYDNTRAGMDVTVYDMLTGAILDGPRDLGSFQNGKWLTWDISGPVVIRSTGPGTNDIFAAVMFDTPVSLAYEQTNWRFRNDDGSETTATWKAAENTDINLAKLTPARLRMQADVTGDAPSQGVKLQYRKVGDTTWEDVN